MGSGTREIDMSDDVASGILSAIADVKLEVGNVRSDVNTMKAEVSRELGGVQTALVGIEKANDRRDEEIREVRRVQGDCEARVGMKGVHARIKRIEDGRSDNTGSIDIVTTKSSGGIGFIEALKSVWPLLILALIGGSAMGGWLLYAAFSGYKP